MQFSYLCTISCKKGHKYVESSFVEIKEEMTNVFLSTLRKTIPLIPIKQSKTKKNISAVPSELTSFLRWFPYCNLNQKLTFLILHPRFANFRETMPPNLHLMRVVRIDLQWPLNSRKSDWFFVLFEGAEEKEWQLSREQFLGDWKSALREHV